MTPSLGLHSTQGLLPSVESVVPFAGVKTHARSVAQSCPTLCDPIDCSPPAPPSMGFSSQEYWSGLPCPPPGALPNPGTEPGSPTLQAGSLPLSPWYKPKLCFECPLNSLPVAGPAPSASLQGPWLTSAFLLAVRAGLPGSCFSHYHVL